MKKRLWIDRTALEEALIALIQAIEEAWDKNDDNEVGEVLGDVQFVLEDHFEGIPWVGKNGHAANDAVMQPRVS